MALLNNPQGQVVNVQVTPGMELEFGFDPGSEAQLERDGDNLIFKFEDGGQIVLTGFYAQEIEQLPTMDIQGAQISAEDFLASLGDETLLPAAGPNAAPQAAQAPGSSGSGAYSDGTGNFIDGVDTLGMLGRIFWAETPGSPLTEIGLEVPGGDSDLDTETDTGNAFAAGAFEDAMPNQNVGDYSLHPAQLHFNFTPTGTSTVTDIAMSGFDAGTKLYIGLPGQPGTVEIEVTGPTQIIHFSQANFTSSGVYFVPPANSDHDMNIHADITVTAVGGLSTVLPVNFVITVDAVADLPTGISTEAMAITDMQGADSTEAKTISVHAGATFSDVLDGTEHHYVEMRGIPSDWTINSIPQGWVLVDANGNPINFNQVARGEHSTYELRFDVTGAATADANAHGTLTGNVGGNVVFNPHDWTSSGATDANGNVLNNVGRWNDGTENHSGPAVIEVRGTAIETPSDGELSLANNTAQSAWTKTDPISVVEDAPQIDANIHISLDETHGLQNSIGEVSLAGLAPNISGAVANAIVGYQGAGELLGASSNAGITFNLHSDGLNDPNQATRDSAGAPLAGGASSQVALSWDMSNLPSLSAKLPEHDGYHEVHYRQSGPDGNGQYTLIGYYEVGGQEYVALVGVLTPNFTTGQGTVTFAEYAAFKHADGLDRNDINTQFGIKITDEDGDVAKANVPLTIWDDVPTAGDNVAAVFDEKDANPAISGNVLDKTVTDHDATNDGAAYTKADSGSDGWTGGNAGVVGYEITLPAGYSVAGNPATMTIGQEYTILYKSTLPAPNDGYVEQGTFVMNANGSWTFTSNAAHDVVKDFDFKVTFTVQDADGDTARADLNIDVNAAPILAGLSGSAEVFESEHNSFRKMSSDDVAGKGHYDVQLYNYDGSAAEKTALYEDVTVTIKVTFGSAGADDFDMAAIQALPGYQLAADGKSFTFTQTVSAGDSDGKISFDLPLNDDSRGGFGTTSDGPVENYKVEISDVSGATPGHYLPPTDPHYNDPAMAGVHTDQNTNIIDDGTFFNNATGQYEYLNNRVDVDNNNPGGGVYNHSQDPHPLDGPILGFEPAPVSIPEGQTANLRLFSMDPNDIVGDGTYTHGEKSVEPIEMVMKFSLANGATAADVTVKAAAVTGATYQYSTDGTNWLAVPAAGIPAAALSSGSVYVKLTVAAGTSLSTIAKMGLDVTAVNDNLSEKHTGTGELQEGFNVSIISAHGNECAYHGSAVGTQIIDVYNNTLAISGNPEVWEAGTLAYTLTYKTDAPITAGTDTIKIVLNFGGSATFGKDYTLADIKAANPNLTFTDLGGGKVEVSIPPAQWSNQGGTGNHTLSLKVPTLHDNQIGEHDETVVIKINSATGGEIDPTKISGTGTGTITEWLFVPCNGDVPAHWVSKNVTIPLNDDRLTEGDEKFTIQLTDVKGHESSLLPNGNKSGGVDGKAELTIVDDSLSANNLDGPALISFGPTADVIEPVRTGLDGADASGNPINQLEGAKTIDYQVTLSQAVAQPTIVFINIKDTSWSDFKPVFGDGTNGTLGVLGDGTNGTWTYAQLIAAYPDMAKYGGLDANGGGYFVIVPFNTATNTGSASATFKVQILHDHDTANNDRGIDVGIDTIAMNITNIQGSETTFDKTAPGAAASTREEIHDDMHGPVVELDLQGSGVVGQPFNLMVKMGATATEDVVVQVQITDANGNVVDTYPVTIPAGSLTGSALVTMPDTDYIYAKVMSSTGGETMHDSDPQWLDVTGTGGGGNPRIVLEFEDTTNIKEEGETTVGYTIGGLIPAGHINEDLSFTLRVVNGSSEDGDFLSGGPGSSVTVTIPKATLDLLNPDGSTPVDFKVVINPDGTVIITDAGGNPIGDPLTVTGDLARAADDKIIEGDETFSTIITNITGGGTTNGNGVIESTIEDNDVPVVKVVFCDAAGNILPVDGAGNPILHGQEGHDDVYVKVILVDATGAPLTLGNGQVTFNLTPGGSATDGTDFSMTKTSVTIPNGESASAPVRIILPDDFKSEGPETLTVNATPDLDPATIQNYPDNFIPGSTGGQTLTIDDYIDGPQITFKADKGLDSEGRAAYENGTVNYTVTLDKALEEDATLTFKVDLAPIGTNTADGFTLEDITSISVDGKNYYVVLPATPDPNGVLLTTDSTKPVYIDGNGDIIVNMNMQNGYSKESFSINLNNDKITESLENFNVQLIETKGGELNLGPDPSNPGGDYIKVTEANGPVASVDVKDVLDGPAISLVRVDASGVEGESITVGLNLSKATVSETKITLELGTDVYSKVVDHSQPIALTDAAGNPIPGASLVDNGDGTVTITLPTGVSGPLHVDFPLQDNAITGGTNDSFSVSLDASGISGGEASIASDKNYGSDFVNETPGSQTFVLTGTGVPNADASCTISLSGVPGNDKTDITSVTFTVDGHSYTVPGSDLTLVNGKLSYTLPDKVDVSLAGVQVTVNFNTAGMTPAEIAAAKTNTSVSGTLSGMELTLPITDDVLTDPDGPVFGVTADAASALDTATSVSFTITPTLKTGFEVVEDPAGIQISFKLTGDYTTGVGVALGDTSTSHVALSGPVGGVYTITLAKGADLEDWIANGGNKLVLTLPAADNVVAADHNLGIQITSVSNTGEASLGTATATTVVEDTAVPAFILTGGAAASENGGIADFTLAATNTGTTPAATSFSFTLGGDHAAYATGVSYNGVALTAGPGGVYTINVPAGTSLSGLSGHITVALAPDADFTSNSQITLVPTGASGCTLDASTAAVTVLESGLNLVLTSTGADVNEGGVFGFNLSLQNAANGVAVTATEALTVTFLVSGLALDGHAATIGGADSDLVIANATNVTWANQGDGTYLVTATLPAGVSELDIHTTARADGIVEHDEGVSFQITALNMGSNAANIHVMDGSGAPVAVGHTESFTIHDGDAAHLPADYTGIVDVHGMEVVDLGTLGQANYDGHLADHGLAIQGTGSSNTIIGSDHNDIIFGGGGNDTLTGGLGDDIFGWHASDVSIVGTPAVDHITDFSMKATGVDGGNDMLDLRDLITVGIGENLSDYLNVREDSGNAVLEIKDAAGAAGNVVQTIVLDGVYNAHGMDSANTTDQDTMNELIKQHILVNS